MPEVGGVATERIGVGHVAHSEPEGEQRPVAHREEVLFSSTHPRHVGRTAIGLVGKALVKDVDGRILEVGLPVGIHGATGAGENVVVLHRHRTIEGVLVEQPVQRSQVIVQLSRPRAEVHEEHAEPAFGSDLHQVGVAPSEAGGVSRRRSVPVRSGEQTPAQVVAPAVVVDLDLARTALLRAHREAAVVGTDVVEGAQHAIVSANQRERLAEEFERTHVAGLGQGPLEGERHPAAVEDALHLEVEERGRREGPRGQGQRPLDGGADRCQLFARQLDASAAHGFVTSSAHATVPAQCHPRNGTAPARCAGARSVRHASSYFTYTLCSTPSVRVSQPLSVTSTVSLQQDRLTCSIPVRTTWPASR